MSYNNFQGSKYDKNMTINDITKAIKNDIKEAIKNNELPEIQVSVRSNKYSMGCSINMTVTECGYSVKNPEWFRLIDENKLDHETRVAMAPCGWMTRESYNVLRKLEEIANAYNYDSSDLQTDYFDSRFCLNVTHSFKLEQR